MSKKSADMSEERKVIIKTEKTDDLVFSRPSSSTTNRLTSLKKPRDLTLGGFKKRSFAPKVQSRKKLDPSTVLPKSIEVKSEKKEHQKLKIKGKRPTTKFVQTASVFEAGTFARPQSSSNSNSTIFISRRKPTTGKISRIKNIEKEVKTESTSLADDVVANLEESGKLLDDDVENDEDLSPVNVNLTTTDTVEAPLDEDVFETESIFKSKDEEKIILFQLPNALPVTPTPSMSATSRTSIKQEAGVSSKADSKITEETDGLIGKLQILRSGKCRLVLGNIKFDIHRGGHPKILQELVSIHLPPDGSSESICGNFTPLGVVKDTVICAPEIQK